MKKFLGNPEFHNLMKKNFQQNVTPEINVKLKISDLYSSVFSIVFMVSGHYAQGHYAQSGHYAQT